MRRYLLIFIIFAIYPTSLIAQFASDGSPIDQELVKNVDVTGDGKPEKIILHLTAKNIKSPIVWTITLTSEGKQIYSYQSDDARLDKNFYDDGYVMDCNDYISCKKKYYYRDILDVLVLTGSKWYNVDGILDKSQPNTLYPLGRKQLQECCNVTGQQADAILSKIENKFRTGKAIAINVLQSPVHANPPLIFVPEVGRFIRFHEE
jgi:hypothetical protein